MTVTYTHEVADCRGLGNFWRLLFRWRGSIYKLVWPDLLIYSLCYYSCSAVYRLLLNDYQKMIFEKITLYCNHYSDLIPVSFVLGFYVSIVIQRWWAQYETLPWPDSLSLFISTSIQGQDNRGRLMRRTIVRYVNLAFTITLTMITSRAKKRFPTLDHLVESGLMTSNEKKIFEGMVSKTNHPLHWLPLVWAGSVVARARKENRIKDDFAMKTIIDEINNFRGKCGGLLSYDWISIPLVYTQVVTLAVYSFFFSTIMGRQFLDPAKKFPNHDLDFYVPVFTFLQFFFYMGWLKVAESLVNPFGEDDDDFEVNYLIDRNLQISYMIVDEMHEEHPELIQDIYWDEVFPVELPYTVASEHFRRDPPMGSTANMEVPEAEQEFLPVVDEEPEDEDEEKGTTNVFKKIGSLLSIGSSHNSGRKNSFISFFQGRMFRNDTRSPEGSMLSVRRSRARGLNRSASRASAGSDTFHMSEESLHTVGGLRSRPISIIREGKHSPIMNMREGRISPSPHLRDIKHSPNLTPSDTKNSPNTIFRRQPSMQDDDGPILIKIKRRDTEGKPVDRKIGVMERDLFIVEDEEEPKRETKELKPKDQNPKDQTLHPSETIKPSSSPERYPPLYKTQVSAASGWSDASRDNMSELVSSPSQCSIRTNIFEAGSRMNVGEEEEDEAAKPLMSPKYEGNEERNTII
ncbi:bestrophin-4-like [Palaemon carinicauda]|uniref:bestrophin-4-like n=1 Tax=Palaemon carinicauda TaxID=392227 RepID=UPI0035B6529E